jgi:hypothetical protein
VPERGGSVLAAWHGVEGILKEEFIGIGAQDPAEFALRRNTPSAGASQSTIAGVVINYLSSAKLAARGTASAQMA